jgi:hypothetical protein
MLTHPLTYGRGNSLRLPFELAACVMSWHKTLLILLNVTAGKGLYNVVSLSQEQVKS